jgi:AcrR family transcriptional regulator
MRRTKEEALVTRENVLTAALQVFSQCGYSAARLEDIARAAEVTRGAIYHHFGSKEELYKALVTERSTGINQIAEYAEEDEEYRALLELTVSKVELTEGLETITRDTVKGRRQLAAYFQELLRQGIQAGEIRSDTPVEPAAYALVSFLNGVGLIWIQDPRAFSLREDAEALVDVFLKGLER